MDTSRSTSEKMSSSKRSKVEADITLLVRGLKSEDVSRDILLAKTELYKLYKLCQREQLMRAGLTDGLIEEECAENWESLSQWEKKAYNEHSKNILEIIEDDGRSKTKCCKSKAT